MEFLRDRSFVNSIIRAFCVDIRSGEEMLYIMDLGVVDIVGWLNVYIYKVVKWFIYLIG